MILRGTEDLRVQKTVAAIDQAFTAMLLESDYEDMSVKELCARAKINKKTFYRYYPTLQDLFREKLERLSTGYLERIAHYKLPEEFRQAYLAGSPYEEIFMSVLDESDGDPCDLIVAFYTDSEEDFGEYSTAYIHVSLEAE